MKNITYKDSKGRTWDYQIPFKIKCTVTGIEKTYTAETYINGKIERFDGLDKMRATYVCKDAKSAMKDAKPDEAGKAKVTVGDVTVEVEMKPEPIVVVDFGKVQKPKPCVKGDLTEDSCHNPAFILDGKPCATCSFSSICTFKDSVGGKALIAKLLKRKKTA